MPFIHIPKLALHGTVVTVIQLSTRGTVVSRHWRVRRADRLVAER